MIQIIKETIAKRLGDSEFDVKYENSPERGHFSTNAAFVLSEKEGIRPKDAAEDLRSFLHKHDEGKSFDRIELAGGGFINIWLSEEVIKGELKRIIKAGSSWGKVKVKVKDRETVIVEYSAPNIAKPMHVGHLRSTIIGDAIANVYEFLGYGVVRWNYLGDWGTQFGKLIAAYKRWGKRREVARNPIEKLEELYIRFHKELKENLALETEGREEFKKLEMGDKKNKKLWRWFKKESLKEFNKIYNRLGISFSTQIGEAFYEKDLDGVINLLKEQGITHESEGALMIELERFDLPPAMIRKSDGATLYFTREIANLKYRIEEYKPKKILYVVANEQTLHFSQLFAVAKMMDITKGADMPELTHIKFGLVRGEAGKKLSTREGTAIKLNELLDRSVELSAKALSNRKVDLKKSEAREVAEILGVGAVKYNDLSQNRMSDIIFDWDKMLSFEGNSAPYLQYTYARLKSILRKAKGVPKLNKINLENERDLLLVLKLSEFPEVLMRVKETYMPSQLASYLYELSKEINSYYHSEPVLYSESEIRAVRLNLVKAASDILKTGLGLLGIRTVETM